MSGIILSPKHHKSIANLGKYADELSQEILFLILLYDKIYLYKHYINNRNYKIVERLVNEGLAEFVPDELLIRAYKKSESIITLTQEKNMYETLQRWPVISLDQYRYHGIKSTMNKYNELEHNIYEINERKKIINKNHVMIEFIVSFLRKGGNKINPKVYNAFMNMDPDSTFNLFLSLNIASELVELCEGTIDYTLNDVRDSLIDGHKKKNDKLNNKYLCQYINLVEAKIHFDAATYLSSKVGIPIKMQFNKKQKHTSNTNTISDIRLEKEGYKVYKILLENIYVPKINNIDDVLKLKKHKNINLFKEEIIKWCELLQCNEFKEESKLRKHLVKANEKLTTIEIRKKEDFEYCLALAAFTIDEVFHLKLPISTILSLAYSGYIRLDEYIAKQKYKWLLVN